VDTRFGSLGPEHGKEAINLNLTMHDMQNFLSRLPDIIPGDPGAAILDSAIF